MMVVVIGIVVVVRHGGKLAQTRAKVKCGQVTGSPSPAMLAALGG